MGNIACSSNKNKPSTYRSRNTNSGYKNKSMSDWNIKDVYNWLLSICDGELAYIARTFKKNKIDGSKLISLTKNQFNEMNISLNFQKRLELIRNAQLNLETTTDYDYDNYIPVTCGRNSISISPHIYKYTLNPIIVCEMEAVANGCAEVAFRSSQFSTSTSEEIHTNVNVNYEGEYLKI
eukprot:50694_1